MPTNADERTNNQRNLFVSQPGTKPHISGNLINFWTPILIKWFEFGKNNIAMIVGYSTFILSAAEKVVKNQAK